MRFWTPCIPSKYCFYELYFSDIKTHKLLLPTINQQDSTSNVQPRHMKFTASDQLSKYSCTQPFHVIFQSCKFHLSSHQCQKNSFFSIWFHHFSPFRNHKITYSAWWETLTILDFGTIYLIFLSWSWKFVCSRQTMTISVS